MRFMQIDSVLQTVNRSEPAKNRFSVALIPIVANDRQKGTGFCKKISKMKTYFYS